MIVEDLRFESDGVELAGTLTLPENQGEPVPGVLTAPGFAGVKEMLIPDYAAGLAANGIAHLGFDYAGFGASSGVPRQQVDPPRQLQAFRDALSALASHPLVDPSHLAVWGTSLSGGHALALAAEAPQIRAVAAVIPFIELKPRFDIGLLRVLALDALAKTFRRDRVSIPVTGKPGETAAMNSDGAFEWAPEMAKGAPAYQNVVTVASLTKMLRWSIRDRVPTTGVPILAVLADEDSITPPELVRDALRGVENIDWESFPESHFELFTVHGDALRELVVSWLSDRLNSV